MFSEEITITVWGAVSALMRPKTRGNYFLQRKLQRNLLTFWGAVRALMRPKTRVNIGNYYLQRKLLFTEEIIITFWGAVSALMS